MYHDLRDGRFLEDAVMRTWSCTKIIRILSAEIEYNIHRLYYF